MKKMKVLTLLLLSVILVFGLAACGAKKAETGMTDATAPATDGKSGDNASTDTGSTDQASASGDNAAKDAEPAMDLGGRTIKIAAWWDDSPKPTDEMGKALVEQQKAVEQKYNIKIEYVNVPFDKYQEKFTTTVLAGQPFADIIRLQYDWALVAAVKGQVLKLGDFTDISRAKNLEPGFPLKGEQYGFQQKGNLIDGSIFYNRDIFKNLGLEDPQELYDKGEWTWDKFEEIAKKATQDTNNDGKPDTWGWSGWDAEQLPFWAASDGGALSDDVNGKQKLDDPKVLEALTFENKLYNVDKVVKVKKGDVDLWEERTTFEDGDVAMSYGWTWETGEFKSKNLNFGVVPFPKGPQLQDPFNTAVTGGGNLWFIPKGAEKPEILIKIYDDLKDVPPLEEYPNQTWLEQSYSTQKDVDIVRSLAQHFTFMNYSAYPNYPVNALVSDVIKNHVAPASAAAKVTQEAQAAIDKILNAQ